MKIFEYLSILFIFSISFGCMNVVLKNTKTNTMQVAKLDQLFELGDTILINNVRHEIIRKKLRNGNIVKKEPIVRLKNPTNIPPPNSKP